MLTWHQEDNDDWFATDSIGRRVGSVVRDKVSDGKARWDGKLQGDWVGRYGSQKEAKASVEGAFTKVTIDAACQRQKEEDEAKAAMPKARKRAKALGYTLKREGRWFWLKNANGWHSAHEAGPPPVKNSSPYGFSLSVLLKALKEEEDKAQEEAQDEHDRLDALAILDEMTKSC